MSGSNVYEEWEKQQPQAGLLIDLNAAAAGGDIAHGFLATKMATIPLLSNNAKKITDTFNALSIATVKLKSDNTLTFVDDSDANTDVPRVNDVGKNAVKLLMQVLHIVSKSAQPPGPGNASGDMKFRINANGNVDVLKDGTVISTAFLHDNVNADTFALCTKEAANRGHWAACQKHMAFIAGVYRDTTSRITVAPDLVNYFAKGTGSSGATDSDEHRVANAFSVLKRVGWRAHDDDSGVYTFKDFDKAARSDAKAMLGQMIGTRGGGGGADDTSTEAAIVAADDSTWVTMLAAPEGANTGLNAYGRFIQTCIEVLNKNTGILKERLALQRFSKTTSNTAGRLASLKVVQPYVSRFAIPRMPGTSIYIGSQRGGATTGNMLRTKLDEAVSNLHRHGKRLATGTRQRFEAKFDRLDAAEDDVDAQIKKIQMLGDNLSKNDPASIKISNNVSQADLDNLKVASDNVAEKTWILETGISNINLKLNEYKAPASAPTSGYYNL